MHVQESADVCLLFWCPFQRDRLGEMTTETEESERWLHLDEETESCWSECGEAVRAAVCSDGKDGDVETEGG